MSTAQSLLDVLQPKPLVKLSRLSYGRLETRGVPAILFGVAAIVLASGASAALRRTPAMLPETLREAREFWLVLRSPRRDMLT
ncbi:MAG: hypothetical protein M3R53_09040 [Candidatus Eremiobacteraeota bacterium]|nr:hypothetical protein [Candidatus Eremiobacteraeota bacterium]